MPIGSFEKGPPVGATTSDILMSIVVADPDRFQLQYRGFFAEPVFSVLGNPARLYTNLLRYMGPFGATAGGLNVNLAVLAQANVSCLFSFGYVRVALDNVELFMREVQSQKQIQQVLNQVLTAMHETDGALQPVRHEATLLAWARLKEELFSSYIRRFVTIPAGMANPDVEFVEVGGDGTRIGTIRLEEAADIREGLFFRSTMNLGSTVPSSADKLVPEFVRRLKSQLSLMNLDVPLRLE